MDELAVSRSEEELEEEPFDPEAKLPGLGLLRRIECVASLEPAEEVGQHFDGADLLAPAPLKFGQQALLPRGTDAITSCGRPALLEDGGIELPRPDEDFGRVERRIRGENPDDGTVEYLDPHALVRTRKGKHAGRAFAPQR